ncbi:hypothetical protein J9303_15775 [Bacillaceae bacterium Marseille-Q3522]|nr:hypothetical protein [Bacillaceae bacterium Marseille-Q3522]
MSEIILQQILEKLNDFESNTNKHFIEINKRLDEHDKRFDKNDARFDHLETEQDLMKAQLSETTQIAKAIYHRQEVTDAKLDALSIDVHLLHGKVEQHQQTLNAIKENQKSISEILGEHEIAIRSLRRKPV